MNIMPNKENERIEYDEEKAKARELTAIRYEHMLRHIYGESEQIPKSFQRWMTMHADRGGAEGYAQADLWHLENGEGHLNNIDVGFVIALEQLAKKVAYLESRIKTLESISQD